MIRLIVNADDLGSGRPRDRGIFAAFANGIVTSASLLANGPNFAAAAAEAIARGLPIGVHLNLSEGPALTGPLPGLTDATGHFLGKTALRTRLRAGRLPEAAIRCELLAQIERVRGAGITPDHLDTHQHCLLFPALTGLIAEVAEHSQLRALRLPAPAEPPPAAAPPERPGQAPTLDQELGLYRQQATALRRALQGRPLWLPDGLWGMALLNRLDTASLAATLTRIPAGTWELMVHPGYRDPADPFGGPEREVELAALTAPAIRHLIAARGITLTSFGGCICAC